MHKKPSAWDNQVFGLVGLRNLGNTCFMNSALQCLLNVVPLTDYFLSELHTQEINEENFLGSKGEVVRAYAKLVKEVWETNQQIEITPRHFYRAFSSYAPQFSYGTQEDSHDFLAILLDVIHEDLNRVRVRPAIADSDPQGASLQEQATNAWKNHLLRNRSIIVDLFQGQVKSSLKCHDCGFVSSKFEPFMYLSLPVPEESKKDVTLYQCLDEFYKEEKLDEEERWHCPKCKAPKDSSKKIDIWTLPNILIIHLKRFKFTREKKGKIRTVVSFPLREFNLSNYLGHKLRDKPIYDLFAISCHEGSLGGGHYTSYVKNRDTSSWYLFNDNFVKEVDQPKTTLVDSSSYVLFYSKTTVDVFARQTISDPQAWPHFMRRFSASGSMIQTDNSIMGGIEGMSPKKIQKYKKQEKEKEEGSGHSVTSLAQNDEIQKEGNENTEQNIDITTLHFNSNMTKPKLKTTLQSVTTERGGGILKRGRIRQSVGALPKDETPMTPGNERNSVDSPRIATEKSNHILAVEYKAPNKSKYEYRSREASEDNSNSRRDPQVLQKNQSFIQMNFSQDMNEQYFAKPIFGINPKFKTSQSRLSNNSELRQHSYAK
jgi:ubiquitin carboxyl-terminal hydrolase 8